MESINKHVASIEITVREALKKLDILASDAILFLVDQQNKLLGSLTDGDIRRGLISGLSLEDHLSKFIQENPKYILQGSQNLDEIVALRKKFFTVFPVIDKEHKIINVVNFRYLKSYLPVDAVIMAGGRGERLKPLTDTTPKPMLLVGEKPIIEHNVDRLSSFGIDDIWISLRYLGDQIENYFGNGSNKGIRISYVTENDPLGTAGALTLIDNYVHDTILMMNSDLLTNIDFEEFYLFFKNNNADLAVACIPYQVNVPYAVMETKDEQVIGFKEKPTYTHYANAGIYLFKRDLIKSFSSGTFFNATDLMEALIKDGKRVLSFPLLGYWLDIGKHDDFQKAQIDIKTIKF